MHNWNPFFLDTLQLVNQRRWLKRPTPSGGPGAKAGLNFEDYKEKVMNVCKAFDKIPGEKVRWIC